ncbi:MAG: zf-HC2 domain-containing protein [Methylococcales bacterium]
MTKQQQNNLSSTDHHALVGLIPWYVKGNLTADENAALKQHLSDCKICQQEELNCRALTKSLPVSGEAWNTSPAHFAGILANVDKLEAQQKLKQSAPELSAAGFFQRIAKLFAQTPRPVRWTLAAESLAFAMLAAVMVLPGQVNPGKSALFETLTNAEPAQTSAGQVLRVVFDDTMTAKELTELLAQSKAQIRQGPSSVGAYSVEVPVQDAAQALVIFQAHAKVRLALPVETNSSKP